MVPLCRLAGHTDSTGTSEKQLDTLYMWTLNLGCHKVGGQGLETDGASGGSHLGMPRTVVIENDYVLKMESHQS